MVINANSIAQSIYADLTLMDGIGPFLDAMDEQQTEAVLAGIENVMALAIAEHIAGPAPAVDDADMFWDSDNPEESFSTDPHSLADSIADLGYPDEEPFEAVIDCAKRFPSRKMKIWSEKDEDGDYYTKWEWVK